MTGRRKGGPSGGGTGPGMEASMRDAFLEMLRELVSVQKGGRTIQMPLLLAASRKQVETALKGSPIAQRDLLHSYWQAAQEQAEDIQEDCEIWTKVKAYHERLLAEARSAGRSTNEILPHPEDIVICWSKGVRLVGPSNAEDLRRLQEFARLRDALYVQEALEERLQKGPERVPSADAPLTLAMLLNAKLPPSLRLSAAGELKRMQNLYAQNKRILLKEAKAAWQAAGKQLPRGWRYMHGEKILAAISTLLSFLPQLAAPVTDPRDQQDLCEEIAHEVMVARYGRVVKERGGPRVVCTGD